MFETVVTPNSAAVSAKPTSVLPITLAHHPGILISMLLAVTLMTTSCGTVAQAAGSQSVASQDSLVVRGNLPTATVSQPYNAVLSVSGGSSPYHFSVKTGALPPGITLNPESGTLSGKPITSGQFPFEVIVTDSPRLDQGSKTFSLVVTQSSSGGVAVTLSPGAAAVSPGQTQQFTAIVSGTSNTAVTWSAKGGSVNSNGLFAAPSASTSSSASVTATSVADPTKSATAAVTIQTGSLQVNTGTLSQGQQGSPYSATLSATGGVSPYTWRLSSGSTPAGTSLNSNGQISGTPTAPGTSNFTVTVTDSASNTATGQFSLSVESESSGTYDGPAQLPQQTVSTAMADTPAPGSTIAVVAGGNLQAALNSAACGDTITLPAGATFTGLYTLPAKSCDANHWIIIRTSSPDSSLPAEGSRLTPCYAGVASLPSRPPFNCSTVNNVLAKVVFPEVGAGPFLLASGANHYRLIGLEITRTPGTGPVGPLLYDQANPVNSIIVDRSWLHGTAQDETFSGVDFTGMTNAAVIDSFFTDFHCTSIVGTCTDAKAVGGGIGDLPGGPYLISDNFLEAAGENILFGGGPATTTPADITIQGNHLFKPLIWQQGRPGFVGGQGGNPFVVKNLFELKNAQRLLFQNNIMEDNWGGFTQFGDALLLTPRDQYSLSQNKSVCPACQVVDITIRYSTISHVGGGLDIATVLSQDGGEAAAGGRYSIHDITIDDIDKVAYNGHGGLILVMNTWKENGLNNVTINHITGFSDPTAHHVVSILGLPSNPKMQEFALTNSILGLGDASVASAGGGPNACAHTDIPLPILQTCFSGYTFSNNAFINSNQADTPSDWPSGNFFPATPAAVQFTNFNDGNGGNYQLLPSSPYIGAGSDGKPLGADIVGLEAAINGVY